MPSPEQVTALNDLLDGPLWVILVAFFIIVIARIPGVNRRLARLLDPVVRWWTRGALTDQVMDRERNRLFRRTQDVDIMESYLDYVARTMVEVRAFAIEHNITLPNMKTFRQYKAEWIRQNPEYRNEFGSMRRDGNIADELDDL